MRGSVCRARAWVHRTDTGVNLDSTKCHMSRKPARLRAAHTSSDFEIGVISRNSTASTSELTGARRHCAARRTLTSMPRGAMPLRVRVERPVSPQAHGSCVTFLRLGSLQFGVMGFDPLFELLEREDPFVVILSGED